jgi:hypothetical protein
MAAKVGTRKPSEKKKANLTVIDGGEGKPAASIPAAGRTVTAKDNQSPEDKQRAKDAAEAAQLISFLSKLGEEGREVAAAKAVLDEKRAAMTETFRLAKAAGFERQELGDLLKDMGTRAKDLVAKELRRRRLRSFAGLPVGEEQLALVLSDSPTEAKDEVFWRSEGYQAGMRGDDAVPNHEHKMPPRFNQIWLEGYHDGQAVIARSMAMVKDLQENGGGLHANANSETAGADDGIPEGYKIQADETGTAFETVDPNEEVFGKPHATRASAIAACRADAEEIARQKAKAAEVQAEEAPQAPAEPEIEDEV